MKQIFSVSVPEDEPQDFLDWLDQLGREKRRSKVVLEALRLYHNGVADRGDMLTRILAEMQAIRAALQGKLVVTDSTNELGDDEKEDDLRGFIEDLQA
jgi:hypothetical protein